MQIVVYRRVILTLAVLSSLVAFSIPIISVVDGSTAYQTVVADDFYYYLIPARSFVETGVTSFDGITETNGYHPLWMAVIVSLVGLSGSNFTLFWILLFLLLAALSITTFIQLRSFSELLFGQHWWVSTVVLGAHCYGLAFYLCGMESSIVLPLSVAFFHRFWVVLKKNVPPQTSQVFLLAFIASLAILARLDIGPFVLLPMLLFLWRSRLDHKRLVLLSISIFLGLTPVLLYFIYNHLHFGHIIPVSGLAKGLHRADFIFSGHMIQDLARSKRVVGYGAFVLLSVIILVWMVFRRRPISMRWIMVYIGFLIPAGSILIAGFRSDWILWIWHLYWTVPSFVMIGCIVFTVTTEAVTGRNHLNTFMQWISPAVISIAFVVFPEMMLGRSVIQPDYLGIESTALRLREFSRAKGGRYAMGDRAGLTASIIERPVTQLEGLMADIHLLTCISAEKDLQVVLREYDVDYLIVSRSRPFNSSRESRTIEIPDPDQSGPMSYRMKTTFQHAPVYVDSSVAGVYTAVFYCRF